MPLKDNITIEEAQEYLKDRWHRVHALMSEINYLTSMINDYQERRSVQSGVEIGEIAGEL